ncbi:dipeptidase [Caballeronia sp. EK]|uniref:dipeptidase n=1 Tax=Caballeronia sp. EK TaxID=2767469 RepID=UPI002107E9E2|nr:dipeptidase [Caballeronia sp. EK]
MMSLHDSLVVIDGTQYSNWNRQIFEEMREGGVAAVNATIVYWENARETLSRIAEWNARFERHADLVMPARTMDDVLVAKRSGRIAILYGLQNCSPIEDDIGLVEVFRDLGVRTMQLTYNNQSLLATGCYEACDGGVTRFGRAVIEEMNRVGMIVDMSHSAERSTLETIALSKRPIVISHANPSFFHAAKRNKSDAVLRALAERGGLVGFSLYPFHLKNGSRCTTGEFTDMVARTVDMIGVDNVGIGSDLCQAQPYSVLEWMRNGRWSKQTDYGEGSAEHAAWPDPVNWFRSNADFPKLTEALARAGFSDAEVAKIMGGNWMRILCDAERRD